MLSFAGDTPLNHATLGQQNQTVAWLAANGANPNLGNAEGFCALHYAAEKGQSYLLARIWYYLISRSDIVGVRNVSFHYTNLLHCMLLPDHVWLGPQHFCCLQVNNG